MPPTTLPKLGKLSPKHDDRTLRLASFVKPEARPTAPKNRTWYAKWSKPPMYLNDKIGCCTIASAGHMIGVWSANASGKAVVLPDAAILKAYIDVTGIEGAAYDPSTGENDNGCAMLDVLKYWKNVGIGGHKILGFVKVNHADPNEVNLAIDWFGGVYTGAALPVTAQDTSKPWTLPVGTPLTGDAAPGSWGGHCIEFSSFSPKGRTSSTWDQLQSADPNWQSVYVDEQYAVLSAEWLYNSKAPSGLDRAALFAALASFNDAAGPSWLAGNPALA